MVETYSLALWGILVIVSTVVVQSVIAASTKAAQPGAVPGKIDGGLSHSSFVFRAHRTFLNSLENFPAILGASFLAILVGADATWSAILIWTYALARLVHMALYYVIATEKNPSPRSYFFLLALAANIGLLVLCAMTLL